MNVLESVEVVVRKAKNLYSWHGLTRIPAALERIKREKYETSPGGGDGRREKSLGLLSQRFVQMFLVRDDDDDAGDDGASADKENQGGNAMDCDPSSEDAAVHKAETGEVCVSLEAAAKKLLGGAPDSSQLKTKVRRLYDIANILSSLNLIQKTSVSSRDSRKPAFKWLGLEKTIAFAPTTPGPTALPPQVDPRIRTQPRPQDVKAQQAPAPAQMVDQMIQQHQAMTSMLPPLSALSAHHQPSVEASMTNPVHYQNDKIHSMFVQYVNQWKFWYMQNQHQMQNMAT